ncbi:MAG: copper amine oxidase N-terminal domain-containing protein [Thermanaeromonas sp.]|uniref:copper amine oxidase N-terminal domain-containing protein n=1 Tax=Thermanaeromonas sp. TaxID=2003697 RepID=UPI00243A53FB|nr:copper amine oxidase N-terminal domain-containing protein [Thermanaeromonas sp.]MCG0278212.1 copper amine oxidase N-terminal domain-containing protein [Thermanaeromonas sp.]
MQRKLSIPAFWFAVFFLIFAGATTAQAAETKCAAFMVGKAEYIIDNVMPVKTDAAPFIEQGRAFIPVRYLARALGVPDDKVSWSPSANTVTLITDKATITLAVGGTVMYVGEQPREMDVIPVLRDGRVYLPARYVAEALGYEVGWDDGNQVIYLWPKGDPRPDVGKAVELFKDWVWIDRGYKIPDPDGRLAYRDSVMPKYLFKTHAGVNIVPRFTDTIEMEIGVAPLNDGGTEEGYKQVEIILASKFGKDFARQVAEYYKGKTTIPYRLEGKDFYTSNNIRVHVMSATYDWINIIISHR